MNKQKITHYIFSICLIVLIIIFFVKARPHKQLYGNYASLDDFEIFNDTVKAKINDYDRLFLHLLTDSVSSKTIINIKKSNNLKLVLHATQLNKDKTPLTISILKNGKTIESHSIESTKKNAVFIPVNKGDKLQITSPSGIVNYNLSFEIYNRSFKEFFICWILFLFWLGIVIYFIKTKKSYLLFGPLLLLILYFFTEIHSISRVTMHSQFIYSIIALAYLQLILAFHYFLQNSLIRFAITIVLFLASVTFFTLPVVFISYFHNFNGPLKEDQIKAFLQSNSGEGFEFISTFYQASWIYGIIALIVLVLIYSFFTNFKGIKNTKKFIIYFASFIIFSFYLSHNYYKSHIFNEIQQTNIEYHSEIKLFKDIQAERKKNNNGNIKASKTQKGETYIIIIGESLNKNHMGLYGYSRPTTPLLSKKKDELIIFNNYFSNHTHSLQTIQLALSEANQINKKKFVESAVLPNVLSAANFETYWISNQDKFGIYDYVISAIAETTDEAHFKPSKMKLASHKKSDYSEQDYSTHDEVVLKRLKRTMQKKTDKNRLIFVHLMGSHGEYVWRYPQSFKIYNGKKSEGEKTEYTQYQVNNYDNSVQYNDSIVNEIIEYTRDLNNPSAVMYFSDHSEDVLRLLGHNIGSFTYDMTQIPMIVWCSEKYKSRYPGKYTNMQNNINQYCSNDMIYDFVLGLSDVKTDLYEKNHDLSDSSFFLPPEHLLTSHGKIKYAVKENKFYKGKLVDSK